MKVTGLILVASLLFASFGYAQPSEATLASVANEIREGESLLVTTSDGARISGRVVSLTAASLTLDTRQGARTLRAGDVRRIVVKDSIRNGLLIGLASGAAAGAAGGLLLNAICVNETGACPGIVLLLTAIGGGAGAGIGAGLDGLRHRTVLDLIPAEPGELSPEIGAAISIGRSRASGPALIGAPSLGAGWLIRHTSGLALALDATRTVGRATHTVACAGASGPEESPGNCVGQGQQGVVDTTIATAAIQYYFTRSRVQPYVAGGAALYQDSLLVVRTARSIPNRPAVAFESLGRHRGVAFAGGAGARLAVTPSLALRPEVTIFQGARWTHVRASVGAAFGW